MKAVSYTHLDVYKRQSRMEKMERSEIIRLLEIHHGKHHLVARDMGMSRTTLWRRLKYYGIQITEEASISGRTAP